VSGQCIVAFVSFLSIVLKVTNISIVHVFSFVEDEHCFNSVFFLKNKVRNQLNSHL
jgi:hypothetical protein